MRGHEYFGRRDRRSLALNNYNVRDIVLDTKTRSLCARPLIVWGKVFQRRESKSSSTPYSVARAAASRGPKKFGPARSLVIRG